MPAATGGARGRRRPFELFSGRRDFGSGALGYGVHLAPVVDEGSIPGPTIYGAGAVLSTTGGHGDVHSIPLHIYEDLGKGQAGGRLADGPAECTKAVREQLRQARVIKICASGGSCLKSTTPFTSSFPTKSWPQQCRRRRQSESWPPTATENPESWPHCAGVKTIEHGTYLDEEAADLMKEKDAILVATRFVVEELMGLESELPHYAAEDLGDGRSACPGFEDRWGGVKIAMGTEHLHQRTSAWPPLPARRAANSASD